MHAGPASCTLFTPRCKTPTSLVYMTGMFVELSRLQDRVENSMPGPTALLTKHDLSANDLPAELAPCLSANHAYTSIHIDGDPDDRPHLNAAIETWRTTCQSDTKYRSRLGSTTPYRSRGPKTRPD
jgi:hypothetical protein